jgi:hypothetical protein
VHLPNLFVEIHVDDSAAVLAESSIQSLPKQQAKDDFFHSDG